MLDNEIIDVLVERLVNRIEQGNTFILEHIGKGVKQIGTLSPTNAQKLAQILKYGGSYQKIIETLARITNLNIKEIYEIFEEVAKRNQLFAKQFYDYRGIDFIPYEQNTALKRQIRALAAITADTYINFSKTLAFARKDKDGKIYYTELSKMYQDVIDEATLLVGQGKETFDKGMYKTLKEMAQSGVKTVDYASGYHRRLDSAVRMNLKGALRDMSIEIQKQFGEEFGADGYEISHHKNAAPDHIDTIDGRQFSVEQFNKVNEGLKRHVGELNCYHYVFPIILGVNKPLYTKEQLRQDKEKNMQGVDIDGKHYTLYEVTQMQRRIETEIRKSKDAQIVGKASGNKQLVLDSQLRITQLTNKYREISQISGLPTMLERARVSGYKRVNVNNI